MKKGKIFSIMLVFLMMISFLPTNIYANDEKNYWSINCYNL